MRERTDPGVELEVVVRGEPPAREHVAARIAIEHHVLRVVPHGERGRAGGDRDRAGRGELAAQVACGREPPGRDGEEQGDRGGGTEPEGRNGEGRAGDGQREPDGAEPDHRGQGTHHRDHEPRRERLEIGLRVAGGRNGRLAGGPERRGHRTGSFARASGRICPPPRVHMPIWPAARLPLSLDGRREATEETHTWVSE